MTVREVMAVLAKANPDHTCIIVDGLGGDDWVDAGIVDDVHIGAEEEGLNPESVYFHPKQKERSA